MNKQQQTWLRLTTAIATATVAGLCWAGPAAAMNNNNVSMDDLPGGQSTTHGGFFAYIQNNSYASIGLNYMHLTGSSDNLVIHDRAVVGAIQQKHLNPNLSPRGEWYGTGIGVDSEAFPGITLGLYLPNTGHHLAIETLIAPPLELSIELRGRAIGQPLARNPLTGRALIPAVGKTVGTTDALSPNFTLVYRPWVNTMIQPYIGVGAMYMYTYDTDVTNTVLTNYNGDPSLDLSNEIACVGQVGVDVMLPHNFFINADVKYIGCAEIENELTGVKTLGGTQALDMITSSLEFEALVYSFNVGMRF